MLTGDVPSYATHEELNGDIVRFDPDSAAVRSDPNLRKMVLPGIRAGYSMATAYSGGSRPSLDCPVYGYLGDEDSDLTPENMYGWKDMTHDSFRLRLLLRGAFTSKPRKGSSWRT